MKTSEVLIIGLFVGPGGLGEGMFSVTDKEGNQPFKIGVSVEMEPSAHMTLTTRVFYRKIKDTEVGLRSYNEYLLGKLIREALFACFPEEAEEAKQETLYTPHALGNDNKDIHQCITTLVKEHGCKPR